MPERDPINSFAFEGEVYPREFEQLVASYQPRLYHFFYLLSGDSATAQNLTNATFSSFYLALTTRKKAGSTSYGLQLETDQIYTEPYPLVTPVKF
jgi:DNA-directed RNA polymerase specialized sigma24 family protein